MVIAGGASPGRAAGFTSGFLIGSSGSCDEGEGTCGEGCGAWLGGGGVGLYSVGGGGFCGVVWLFCPAEFCSLAVLEPVIVPADCGSARLQANSTEIGKIRAATSKTLETTPGAMPVVFHERKVPSPSRPHRKEPCKIHYEGCKTEQEITVVTKSEQGDMPTGGFTAEDSTRSN